MTTFAIWLPTFHRPHKLEAVIENIRKATKNPYELYFGVEPEDMGTQEELRHLQQKMIINEYDAGYSNTIQTIYENTHEPIWFHANDDFIFLPNWDEHPIAMFETESVKVVGVPQNEADKSYSAICFARRSYIEEDSGVIDMPNRVFYPYHHNYIDTEFTRTAQHRNVWAASSTPCIDHDHPGIKGGEKDEVYKKNDATATIDEQTFKSRQHLWE